MMTIIAPNFFECIILYTAQYSTVECANVSRNIKLPADISFGKVVETPDISQFSLTT